MPLWSAVTYVRSHKNDFSCVEVKYADQDPLGQDVVLNFPEHGLHLRFEPSAQRLRLIEVYDTSRLQIRYGKGVLGGAAHAATAMLVYELLGPAVPGTLNVSARLYPLRYPGVLFLFPIPAQHVAHCRGLAGELPLEFPDNTTPVASRICVYAGAAALIETPEEVAAALPPPLSGSGRWQPVEAAVGEGLRFADGGGRQIGFGDGPQDVCAELGQPSAASSKLPEFAESSEASSNSCTNPADYFYTYEDRGLDILFDGRSDRAKKFVLHTNPPGHADFGLYLKCSFKLSLQPRCSGAAPVEDQSIRDSDSSDAAQPADELHCVAQGGLLEAGSENEASSTDPPADSLLERSSRGGPKTASLVHQSRETGISAPSTPSKGIMGFLEDLVKSPAGDDSSGNKDQAWEWDSPAWTNGLLEFGAEPPKPEDPAAAAAAAPAADPDPRGADLPSRRVGPSASDAEPDSQAAPVDLIVRGNQGDAAETADQRDGWDDLDALGIDLEADLLRRSTPGLDLSTAGAPPPGSSSSRNLQETGDLESIPPPPTLSSPTERLAGPVSVADAEKAEASSDQPESRHVQARGEESSEAGFPELTANSSLEEIRAAMGDAGTAKMHMRGQSSHPFGRTQVLGYPGACFEVMRNGHLASVTLY